MIVGGSAPLDVNKMKKIIILLLISSCAFSQPYVLEKIIDNGDSQVNPRKCSALMSFNNYIITAGGVGFYENSEIRYPISDTWVYDLSLNIYFRTCDGSFDSIPDEGEGEGENYHFCIDVPRCSCSLGCVWSSPVLHNGRFWIINPATDYNPVIGFYHNSNDVYFLHPETMIWVKENEAQWDAAKNTNVFSYRSVLWAIGGATWNYDTGVYEWLNEAYSSPYGDFWNSRGVVTGLPSNLYTHPAVFRFGVYLVGYQLVGNVRQSKVYYSKDCLLWEEILTTGFPTTIGGENHSVQVWDDNLFLFFTNAGTDYVYRTGNGTDWQQVTTFPEEVGDYNRTWFSTCLKTSSDVIGDGILISGGAGDVESGYPSGYSNDVWFLRDCHRGGIIRNGTVVGYCDCSVGFTDMGVETTTDGYGSEQAVFVNISVLSGGLSGEYVTLEEGLVWGNTYSETYFYDTYGDAFDENNLVKIGINKYNFYNMLYYYFDECGYMVDTSRTVILVDPYSLANNTSSTYQIPFDDPWVDPGVSVMPDDVDISTSCTIFMYKADGVTGVRTLLNVGGTNWNESVAIGHINANGAGNYEAWYYYTDDCGGTALVKRYITAYGTGSGLFLIGETDFDIECSSYSEEESWVDSGVLALDDGGIINETPTVTMVIFKYVEDAWIVVTEEMAFDEDFFYSTYSGVVGDYKIEYHYTDGSLTEHTSIRLVSVVDETPPIIVMLGDSTVDVNCGDPYIDSGAVPYLQCGSDLDVVSTNNVDYTSAGDYSVVYTLEDSEGNDADEVTRTVNIVDTEEPEICLIGSEITEVVSFGGVVPTEYYEPGYVAYDVCEGDLTQNVTVENRYLDNISEIAVGESYPVIYTVSDSSGNIGTKTRWMVVESPSQVNTGMINLCRFDIVNYRMNCYAIEYSSYIEDMFSIGVEGLENFWISSGTFKIVDTDFVFDVTDGITSFLDKCVFVVYFENKSYLFYAFLIKTGDSVALKIVDACEIVNEDNGVVKSIIFDDTKKMLLCMNTIDGIILYEVFRENNLINLKKASDFQESNVAVLMATTRYGNLNEFNTYEVPVGFKDKSLTGMYKINKWDWSFGDGKSSKDKNPIGMYVWPDSYNVRMSVATDFSSDSISKTLDIGVNLFKYGVLNKVEIRSYGKHNTADFLEGYGATWNVSSSDVLIPIVNSSFPLRTTTYLARGTVTVTLVPDSKWELSSASIKINGGIYDDNISSSYSFNTGVETGYVYEIDSYFESNND